MSKPGTRAEFKEYCLRQLGAPVLEINLATEQCEDIIDDAIQFFQERHFDGVAQVYLKYKITQADVDYIGSITIDPTLMNAANIIAGEKVQVLNISNGERLETYVISGQRGSGEIIINGPAALKIMQGHQVIIISYMFVKQEEASKQRPTIIFPEEKTNKI